MFSFSCPFLIYILSSSWFHPTFLLFYKLCSFSIPRACLKNHSHHLHAPLCAIFAPNSGYIARYAPLIWRKSPTNCDAHLPESIFQTRSKAGGGTEIEDSIKNHPSREGWFFMLSSISVPPPALERVWKMLSGRCASQFVGDLRQIKGA